MYRLSHRSLSLLALAFLLALAACRAPKLTEALGLATAAPSATPSPQPSPTATPSFDELLVSAQDATNSGDWGGAINMLDQALILNNASPQAYFLLGNVYKASGDFAQAISNYEQAIALDPNFASAYQSRGLTYQQLGNTDQALADISKAIEITPTFALAYRNRAEIQKSLGNVTAASYDLQVYLTLLPNAPDAAQVQAEIDSLQAEAVQKAGETGLLFSDNFSDPNSGWFTNGDPVNLGLYADSGYLQVEKQTNGAIWSMPGRLFTDVRLEVTATKQGGADDSSFFGIICRVQGTTGSGSYYAFLITGDGFFGIAAKDSSGALGLLEPPKMLQSSAINHGNATNKITAVCSGDRLALYVNDQLLVETHNSDFGTGQVGLITGAFANSADISVFFDDFNVFAETPQ